ncbi:MAG: C39 family peptidase [Peptoniphilaceae bacterium]|uniref:C39 family peptidase n=1 Tax=Parvimonas sp. TaxID=1944660 RepID=UPI0025DC4177|nr:C39 family peptidase [Parvimonas sp.]MCI5996626.1 C39 family peptidase [Parvimonas sp.]MDD7765250.1 C39 family peptidase [Peptoniphilaceae bacterium]MDY3051332.1 C39 family peptidase [Parvimonas sp.]
MKRNVIKILTFLFLFIITKSLFVHSDYICAEVTSQKYTGYKDNKFYFNGELANWWYDDGSAWYFFKDGKKLTGKGKDSSGERYFKNGKYANGYLNKLFCDNGKLANWWYDDGSAWYFFKDGKKLTGKGKDASGEKYFVNGKYANGFFEGKLFKEGIETKGKVYIKGLFYGDDKKLANWWYDDGSAWYFFKDGKKLTGYGKDSSGEKYFVNGKYANGYYIGKYFTNGNQITIPSYYRITDNIYVYDFSIYRYYTGCWLLSAASGLHSKGVSVNPTTLLSLLPNTGDPRTGTMGNPSNHSYMHGAFPASYPSGMLPTLKKLLPTVEDISGASFETIKYELSRGNTVQIWYSRVSPNIVLNAGNGDFYASSDYHSILLTGYDSRGFYCIESVGNNYNVHVDYNSGANSYYGYLLMAYERFGRKAIVYR